MSGRLAGLASRNAHGIVAARCSDEGWLHHFEIGEETMLTAHLNRRGFSASAKSVALIVVAAALGGNGITASAEERPGAPRPMTVGATGTNAAHLEQAFWACDHAATTQGVDRTSATTCVEVSEELKQEKFGGDFERMLEWWRQNKVAEHRKLDRLDKHASSR